MLDIQMPVMNGLEAARAIRAQGGRGLEVPMIALTAFTQESDRRGAEDAGIDCFVSKPVRSQNIQQAIREALEGGGAPAAPRPERELGSPLA